MLNYITIKPLDSANGSGIATSIFFSGCRFHCPDCFNSIAWDENAGKPVTDEVIDEFISYLKNPHVSHSAILGGEPLLLLDPETMEHFLCRVKTEVPDKPIWMWTGYELEDLKNSNDYLDSVRVKLLNKYVDYLIMDFKHHDNNELEKYTGVGTEAIKRNFEYLCQSGRQLHIRELFLEVQAIRLFIKRIP